MSSPTPPTKSRVPTVLVSAAVGAGVGVFVARNFFATAKKIRREVVTGFGVDSLSFVRTMSDLLGPPLLPGNRVELLNNGVQIFPAMLAAIRAARQTITFENFDWEEGRLTRELTDALAERADAGVRVHVLQDALGCKRGLHGPSLNRLRRSPAQVEIFRRFQVSRANLRTHRKLLVVDGRVGFIGGAGIADNWLGDARGPDEWRDTHYRVEGPVVAQLQRALMENWMQTRAEVVTGDGYFPEQSSAGDKCCQVFKSSASEGADSARVMFLLSLAAARRTIRIANAYFVPDDLAVQTLVQAARRGVRVEIITPNRYIDKAVVRYVSRERWGPMLAAGVRFYEFQPTMFHCKYMIVDDCWVSAGSANFDNRSFRLNDEANLNVYDAAFAAEHVRVFEDDKARAEPVTLAHWKRRPFGERMAGRVAGLLRSQL